MNILGIFLLASASSAFADKDVFPMRERQLDKFAVDLMKENGHLRAAAPQCKGQLGWVYHNGFCYMFTRFVPDFLF